MNDALMALVEKWRNEAKKSYTTGDEASLREEMADELAVLAAQGSGDDFPMGAIENGRCFADRLEQTDLQCIAGSLQLCVDWHEFRRCFEYLSAWALRNGGSANPTHGAVPDAMPDIPVEDYGAQINLDCEQSYVDGWNACRDAMLANRREDSDD